MQQLEERNTYAPTDIPHVSGNCDLSLNRTETSVHAVSTYGTATRVCDVNWRNGLEETFSVIDLKTSFNNSDAALIATEHAKQNMSRQELEYLIQNVRKCNRKLFKGDRSHIKNTAARIIHGFQRFDKVLWNNIKCFVFGRRKTGYFELRKLDGTKIHALGKAKELTLLETANPLLIVNLKRGMLLHTLKSVVSATSAPHGVL